MGLKKCTNKINFKRTNRIQDDDLISRGEYFGGKRRKLFCLVAFLAYLLVGLLKCQVYTLIGCGIKFHIQRVSIKYTFEKIHIDKNHIYIKKVCSIHFLMYLWFLSMWVFLKVCIMGTHWMWNLIPHVMSVYLEIWLKL